jgi:hypothetical protein
MVITESVRIRPGTYRARADASPDSALVVIRGDGVEVDLSGVRFQGTRRMPTPTWRRAWPSASTADTACMFAGGRSVGTGSPCSPAARAGSRSRGST